MDNKIRNYYIKVDNKYLKDFELVENRKGVRSIQSPRFNESDYSPILTEEKIKIDPITTKGFLNTLIEWSRWNDCSSIIIEIEKELGA